MRLPLPENPLRYRCPSLPHPQPAAERLAARQRRRPDAENFGGGVLFRTSPSPHIIRSPRRPRRVAVSERPSRGFFREWGLLKSRNLGGERTGMGWGRLPF